MERAKLKFKNQAEQRKAMQQADDQFERARGNMRGYLNSQSNAFLRMADNERPYRYGDEYQTLNDRAKGFASEKVSTRYRQLEKAYDNRLAAIANANIGG